MGQIVNKVIHTHTIGKASKRFGINRVVGMFPGVAQIHVVASYHHQAPLLVEDSTEVGRLSVLSLIRKLGLGPRRPTRHLYMRVLIVQDVEDRIALAQVDELADECFVPLTVGGGVRSVEDIRGLLLVGADGT